MAVYEFRCDADGVFQVTRPMGAAARREPCPRCGGDGARVFSTPMLGRADRRAAAAIERGERSAERPDVVTSLPPRRPPRRAAAASPPGLARLPRP